MDKPSTSGMKRTSTSATKSVTPKKKIYSTTTENKNHEDILREWLNENSESDCDEIGSNFIPLETDHDTESEQEGSDEEKETSEQQQIEPNVINRSQYYFGKNRFKWSKTSFWTSGVRTLRHNIIASTSISASTLSNAEPKDVFHLWRKFFDDSIYQEILTWTNIKLLKYRENFKTLTELHDIDDIELNAFLGLLLYSAVFKSNHEDCDLLFATDGTGRDIFRCVLSKNRFMHLLNCLRFDNPSTRAERQSEDKTAAISYVFNTFVNNCRKNYRMGINATIDEMLIGFRGRSHLIIYMPQKPAKYGLKVQAICDSKTFYFYDGYIYSGKGSDSKGLTDEEKKLQVPTQCVLRLTRDLHGSNRNITADNWYSSVQCVEELKKKGLTFVGTLKKNKREIPPNFLPNKTRDVGSTVYGFTKDITLISHVPKQNKAVILLSSMHHNEEVNEENNKPEIISYYNSTKGGVDELDKKCSIYSSSRRTRRWSMAIFFRMLDLSAINAGILYNYHSHKKIEDRSTFLKLLARSLVVPHMQRRHLNKHLPRELRLSIHRVLGSDVRDNVTEENDSEVNQTRKICYICPSKLRRKTAYKCNSCKKHVCLQCSKPVCKECL